MANWRKHVQRKTVESNSEEQVAHWICALSQPSRPPAGKSNGSIVSLGMGEWLGAIAWKDGFDTQFQNVINALRDTRERFPALS